MKIIWDSKRNWTIVFLLIVIAVMVMAQQASRDPLANADPNKPVALDLPTILERDTLRVLTGNNSVSYFLYKGRPMGFEYEMIIHYADDLDVELEFIVAENQESYFQLLNKGEVDIVAANLTVTQDRQEIVDFCHHHTTVNQVLVQRLPERWWIYTRDQLNERLIRNPLDLIGKPVHVRKNSSFDMRLRHLSNEIGGPIDIQYHDGRRSTEELIEMVSNGTIDYTIADHHVAELNATYFKNIDVNTEISFPQRIAWAVRNNAPELKASIDAWTAKAKKSGEYRVLYQKYFQNSKAFSRRKDSDLFSENSGSVSVYDDLLKEYAATINWDWRLLAAQVYKESQFNNNAVSWAGARGLMQLIPETAERFGDSTRVSDPEYNLKLGTRYLAWLWEFWEEIPDSSQRVKFVLASYNVGEGHVLDARRLAEKYGKNGSRWDEHVDSFLVKKAYPAFYRDEVVYNGYCRGSEPYKYVRDIFTIYGHYRELLPS